MTSVKIVHWREADGMWLGYLESHPDYMTQGETLEELKENLRDIFNDQAGRTGDQRNLAGGGDEPVKIVVEQMEL